MICGDVLQPRCGWLISGCPFRDEERQAATAREWGAGLADGAAAGLAKRCGRGSARATVFNRRVVRNDVQPLKGGM